MRTLTLLLTSMLAAACFGQTVIGRTPESERAAKARAVSAFTGLEKVRISVLYQMPQPNGQGLAGKFQDALEAKLKEAGVTVVWSRDASPDLPTLEISVGLNVTASLMNVEARLKEPVTIARNGKRVDGISLSDIWLYSFDRANDKPENNPHTQAQKAFDEVVTWLVQRRKEAGR